MTSISLIARNPEMDWLTQRNARLAKALRNQAKKVLCLQRKVGSLTMWGDAYIAENHRLQGENRELREKLAKIAEFTRWEGSSLKP